MAKDAHVRYVTLMAPWRETDVANYLGVTVRTVRSWYAKGLIPGERVGAYLFFNPYDIAKRVGCAE